MPRPTTKNALLEQSQSGFEFLDKLATDLGEQGLLAPFPEGMLNRNARDVIAHLHHWHLLFLGWYEAGMRGEMPVMPAKGYTWKDTLALNQMINEKYAKSNPLKIWGDFEKSHEAVLSIIRQHTDEELFTKKYYAWTGSTSLGAYLVSAGSSHYSWALRVIKKALGKKG